MNVFMMYCKIFTVFVCFTTSGGKVLSGLGGRTQCSEGYVLYEADMTCHRPYSQGPCPPYQQLIDDQEGVSCRDIKKEVPLDGAWSITGLIDTDLLQKTTSGWKIPSNETDLDPEELTCLAKGQIFWPDDRQCYDLLSAGPCSSGEWLALEEDPSGDRVVCKPRNCPCDPAYPELCEVEVRDGDCKCKVALAAAQDGLCDPGEQLLLDPYGFGICGCITSPPHATWPVDDQCYALYTQGPCDEGFQFSVSPSTLEASCRPAICLEKNSVMWEDGVCYTLGERGPCEVFSILTVDDETKKPMCTQADSHIKRMFDMLPGGFIRQGPVSIKLKARNCVMDGRGKCKNSFRSDSNQISRKRGNSLYIRRRSSRSYINWLKQFKDK